MIEYWFQRIREVPILDVISSLGILFSSNGKDKVRHCCILPNHAGPNKTGTSFSIDRIKNLFYCFGCRIGGGNIELVKYIQGCDSIEAANLIAQSQGLETFEEVKASTPEEKANYQKRVEEQTLVYEILTIAAHHFQSRLTPELLKTLLIPQGQLEPKETWKDLYATRGLTEVIEENLIGFDDSTLYSVLKEKRYNDEQILKSGLFYKSNNGIINSVFKNRLTFPYIESGRVVNFIARSTSQTWPCYLQNPTEALAKSQAENPQMRYAKYKKLPLHQENSRPYISQVLTSSFFGLSELRLKKHNLVVEGITDVILLRQFFKIAQKVVLVI